MRRPWSLAFVVAFLVIPATASAQVNAEAEQLFRDGKRLMGERRIGEACDAFATSQRLEPHIATLLSLADCREKNGQLATAWALFLEAERQTRNIANQTDLHATSDRRATALEPRLSFLTINVPDESRVPGLEVTHDGVVVDPGLWNRAVPVDGGDHVIEGKAPGHEPWSTHVSVLVELDRQAVEVPKFKELPALVTPKDDVVSHAPPGADGVPDQRVIPLDAERGMSSRRKAALIVGGVGVAGLATGLGIGVSARQMYDDAVATCPDTYCTTAQAEEANALHERAQRRATTSNIVLGVGAVAVVGAAYLWFTDREPGEDRVTIAPQLGGDVTGLAITGGF